jgi:hypothetical protein
MSESDSTGHLVIGDARFERENASPLPLDEHEAENQTANLFKLPRN